MSKLIVSYDGTANDEDAVALARILSGAGADVALAYVRHAQEEDRDRDAVDEKDADQLLERGARSIGAPAADRHVIVNASTPDGLRRLAESENADVVVFGSDAHTAAGSVHPQTSAQRLLNGGPAAVAIAPAGLRSNSVEINKIGVIAEGDDKAAAETADSLASALGAEVVDPGQPADLLVVGSAPDSKKGQVTLSAAAEYALETAKAPVIAVANGTPVKFASKLFAGKKRATA